MPKPTTLDALLSKEPDRKKGGKTNWQTRLQAKHPEFWEEVSSLIDRHIAGDATVRRKLPSEVAVCEWLKPHLAAHGESVAAGTIGALFRERRAAANGKT